MTVVKKIKVEVIRVGPDGVKFTTVMDATHESWPNGDLITIEGLSV